MPPKRMTANPVRPARYRPGKPVGPEPQESSGEEEEEEEVEEESADEKPPRPTKEPAAIVSSALKRVDLNKRFEQARKEEEARKAEEESSEGENEEGADKKGEDESEEGSSEYTSESESESEEEEAAPTPVLLRPKFIPKSKRSDHAVASVTAESATTALDEENLKKKAEEAARRKEEAHALVEEHLRQQAEARETARKAVEDDHANDASLIDDTDDVDPAAERAAWKLRELLRVKRERDELEKVEKEREEIERRRNMDEKERYKEDMEYARKKREEAKEARGDMKFMQKYYHKGAFYQDDSEILKRNYATALVEDQTVNKEILPKYMQVRGEEYGKRGKTKWTHLAAEDTSKVEGGSPWFDRKFAGNTLGKIGGMKDERFLPDKAKVGRDDKIDFKRNGRDRWDANGKQPPEGPKAMSSHNRSRAQECQEFDRHQPGRSWSWSRSRDRDRARDRDRDRARDRDRDGDRYYPRHGDRQRDYRRDGVREHGGYGDRELDRDADRRDRSRDKEGDRKRRPIEKDESMDKRRRVEAP
ncbi:splicing factor, Prp19-binding domain-containing protein [Tirmania nivea]|nr:splicing factor, Prp19-binding domain-containing protein [Tirmania nivea]